MSNNVINLALRRVQRMRRDDSDRDVRAHLMQEAFEEQEANNETFNYERARARVDEWLRGSARSRWQQGDHPEARTDANVRAPDA